MDVDDALFDTITMKFCCARGAETLASLCNTSGVYTAVLASAALASAAVLCAAFSEIGLPM